MKQCKKCSVEIQDGFLMQCECCGTMMCADCAASTLRICPYCYSDLEFKG